MAVQLPWRYVRYQRLAEGGVLLLTALWITVVVVTMDYASIWVVSGCVLSSFFMAFRIMVITTDLSNGKLNPVIRWERISPENPSKEIHQHLVLYILLEFAVIPLILLPLIFPFSNLPAPALTTFAMLYIGLIGLLMLYHHLKPRNSVS